MAAKNKGLGKGLDALLGGNTKKEVKVAETKVPVPEEAETYLKVRMIEPNREQPRKEFKEEELKELAESIKTYGIIQPLVVVKKKDYYQIVAGERRWRAAKLAGLKEVPVIIKKYTEKEIAEISLIENIQRESLNPVEEAEAYQTLLREYGMTQEELAERLSKSRTKITNAMRLLKLPEAVKEMVLNGKLSEGHAKVLLSVEDPKELTAYAEKVISEALSVRETEKLLKKKKPSQKAPKVLKNQAVYDDVEEKLKAKLGTRVAIKRSKDNAGKIEIEFYTLEDFERIYGHIH